MALKEMNEKYDIRNSLLNAVKAFNQIDFGAKICTPFRAPGLDFEFLKDVEDIDKALFFYMAENKNGEVPGQERELEFIYILMNEEDVLGVMKDFIDENEEYVLGENHSDICTQYKEKFVNFLDKFNELRNLIGFIRDCGD